MTKTIPMDNATKRFYQGVASASRVNEEHASVEFPDSQSRVVAFWFYVGVLAGTEHGCETSEDMSNFVLGASTRAPSATGGEDGDDD